MSAVEETILNFSWIKERVIFNPQQGKDADSTKNKSAGNILVFLKDKTLVVFNTDSD